MFKRSIIVIICLILLILLAIGMRNWLTNSKNQPTDRSFSYQATYTPDTPEVVKSDLVLAIQRVVKTKLQAMGALVSTVEVEPTPNGVSVNISAHTEYTKEKILQAFTVPYDFQLMRSVPLEEAVLIVNPETPKSEGYAPTAISGSSLYYADTATLDSGLGAVRIELDTPAQEALELLYKTYNGSSIGIFVKNQLIAKLLVTSEEFDKDIRILNVPDPTIAQIFADDINVGRYVQFSY